MTQRRTGKIRRADGSAAFGVHTSGDEERSPAELARRHCDLPHLTHLATFIDS
jgi:hypothetical protein